jgi:hypothetical protein
MARGQQTLECCLMQRGDKEAVIIARWTKPCYAEFLWGEEGYVNTDVYGSSCYLKYMYFLYIKPLNSVWVADAASFSASVSNRPRLSRCIYIFQLLAIFCHMFNYFQLHVTKPHCAKPRCARATLCAILLYTKFAHVDTNYVLAFSNVIWLLMCRSHWQRDLRSGSAAASLLGLRGRTPPGARMSLVNFVCCWVVVSASGWSLVKRSATECGVPEYDREASTLSKPWPTRGCCARGGGGEFRF